MMRWIIQSSMKFRLLVLALAAALLVVGITRLSDASVDVLPEFAPPYVEVQTEALGLSAAEVESLVSLNLEELLNGTPWLDSIRSTSVPGLSSVVLNFEPGTDVTRARQLAAERLTLAYALPNVSQPPVILQPRSATGRVLMVALTSQQISPIKISVLARWTVRPALLAVPGVANVSIWGYQDRQLQVRVDPKTLAADNITLDQIVRTAGNAMWVSPLTYLEASTPGTGGWIETPQQRLEVRHVFPITGPDGLSKVRVEDAGQRLGQVAKVVEDHPPLIGDAVLKNGPGLLLVIEKFPGSNTREVTRNVETALRQLGPGLAGITADTSVFRPSTYIDMSTSNLTRALWIGALLALLVLIAALYNWRALLIVAIVIPVSLVAAGLVVTALGATLNAMVIAGMVLALAVVVDEVVVDVENVLRRRRERADLGERPSSGLIAESLLEMRRGALYGALIVGLAMVPVPFMGGVAGSLFQPLALSFVLALAAAMVAALTLTPALAGLLLTDSASESHESPFARWLQRAYAAALGWVIRRPNPTLAVAVLGLAVGAAVVPFLGRSYLPAFKDPNLVVRWNGAPGTSSAEMSRITTRLSDELENVPGVKNVTGQIGRAVLGDQVVDVNSTQVFVALDPDADYATTLGAVRQVVRGYPGLARDVDTYEARSIERSRTGPTDPIVVGVFGPNLDLLNRTAAQVGDTLSQIDGVADVHMPKTIEQPHIAITVDLTRARRFGLKPGDVRREAATLVAGLNVGSLFEEQKVFSVSVWTKPETRHSLSDVENLLIGTPTGGHVRLGDVADVRVTTSPALIKREAVSRRVRLGLSVTGRDVGAVTRDVKSKLASMSYPLEYRAAILAGPTAREAPRGTMIVAGFIAAVLALLLFQAAFRSWRLAAVVFLAIPCALLGGVFAAGFAGDAVSLGSVVAFLTVLGITVRHALALVGRYQHLQEHDGLPFGADLVVRGARERLLPVVLTVLTIVVAFLPLLITGQIAGQEIVNPLATIVVGGLVTSALVTLFLIPGLYLRFGGSLRPPQPEALT